MQRLVYSPHVWVFIRSANHGGRIYDVSDDCVRGSVTQVVGDVCTANFELRNRFKKWLRDPVSKQSIFLPMDLVTIWMQRLPGSPIQQFTGYLNEVPYYQGYPANAIFSATCTLKKAAFTWFDPGLITFQQWLITNGWAYDPTTGQAFNPRQLYLTSRTSANTPLASNMTDGGFADLLSRFMVEVALWSPNDVLVSQLPPDLPKIAASLYTKIAQDAIQELSDLENFMSQAMGVKGTNIAATPTATSGTSGPPSQNTKAIALAATMKQAASDSNIPAIMLAYAARSMTNYNENYDFGPSAGSQFGYGIYALRTNNTVNGQTTLSIGARNYSISDLKDTAKASEALCLKLHGSLEVNSNWLTGARNGDPGSIHDWLANAIGYAVPEIPSAIGDAQQFLGADVPIPAQTGSTSVDPSALSWTAPSLTNLLTTQEKTTVSTYYAKQSADWIPALAYRVKYYSQDLRLARPPSSFNLKNNEIYVIGLAQTLDNFFNSIQGDSTIDQATRFGPEITGAQILRNGVVSSLPDPTYSGIQTDGLIISQTKPASSVATSAAATASATTIASTTPKAASAATPGAISPADLAAFSATSAFAANMSFPSDIITANLLTGERALMNDTSCMWAIKQFAASSLRTFRALPDGRFLAFYPDYFGAYRDPYWKIYNIELIDFGIQLNDEALATHVYVSGDTIDFNGQVDFFEQISTAGVATINHADMVQSFIQSWDETRSSLGRLNSSYTFLEHYGARPLAEDQPLIRNTAYEFLYAWQKFMLKWAQQFATSVSFTFHPEIMAGGLIEFPDHQVQCFVDQVTHAWDYESGFTTEAVLTAPSIPKQYRKKGSVHPGFALGGNTNTVGVLA